MWFLFCSISAKDAHDWTKRCRLSQLRTSRESERERDRVITDMMLNIPEVNQKTNSLPGRGVGGSEGLTDLFFHFQQWRNKLIVINCIFYTSIILHTHTHTLVFLNLFLHHCVLCQRIKCMSFLYHKSQSLIFST